MALAEVPAQDDSGHDDRADEDEHDAGGGAVDDGAEHGPDFRISLFADQTW
jgi:hypothetical protein